MPPGFFTQGTVVLFDRSPSVDLLTSALDGFTIARTAEPADHPWVGGPGVVVAMRPEVNGYVLIDVMDKSWPDHMGDPEKAPDLLAAWATGWFGPYAFPDGLSRAVSQAHHLDQKTAVLAREHRAFVRINSTYALGADENVPIRPPDYDASADLRFVTSVARALLAVPGASFYFNASGELLHSADSLAKALDQNDARGLPPLPAWSNIRILQPPEAPGWRVMDTVGMEQLGVADHEACVPLEHFDLGDVAAFLRNATFYTYEKGPVICERDTIDGPGGRWQVHLARESLGPPPRPVLRWRPIDVGPPPPCFAFPTEKKSSGWKFWKRD